MKFSGYIIWNSLSFFILPTSTHIVTIFPFPLHYFNFSCSTPSSVDLDTASFSVMEKMRSALLVHTYILKVDFREGRIRRVSTSLVARRGREKWEKCDYFGAAAAEPAGFSSVDLTLTDRQQTRGVRAAIGIRWRASSLHLDLDTFA